MTTKVFSNMFVGMHGRAYLQAGFWGSILLLLCLCPGLLLAQNGVALSNLTVRAGTAGAASTLTIDVSWTPLTDGTLWSDSVWVFVDYNKDGVMVRLLLIDASASAGTVTKISGNDRGIRIAGNARTNGSFSATVQLFTASASLAGICVYASNYPPVGRYTSSDEIKFTGTPPFHLDFDDGSNAVIPRATAPHAYIYTLPADKTLVRFTDATAAPGKIIAFVPKICKTQSGDITPGEVNTVKPEPAPGAGADPEPAPIPMLCVTQPGDITPGEAGVLNE
jgi:hypothetical protein